MDAAAEEAAIMKVAVDEIAAAKRDAEAAKKGEDAAREEAKKCAAEKDAAIIKANANITKM